MSLEGAVLAVVAADRVGCEPVADVLRAAGATVKPALVSADALATLSAPGFDAAVLDVGDEPERFIALAASIRDDPRTQGLPVFALPSASLPSRRLAGLGPVHVLQRHDDPRAAGMRDQCPSLDRARVEQLEQIGRAHV